MVHRSHGPLWVNVSPSLRAPAGYAPHRHRSRGPSGLTRLNAAARHNTRMGLWGGVRHPRFFWPVWRHILGGPMRVPSHANRGAGSAHTTVGVGGPGQGHFLGCALHPCKPWGVMGRLLPFLASSTRREGRHREAGVLSRRPVVFGRRCATAFGLRLVSLHTLACFYSQIKPLLLLLLLLPTPKSW